MTIQRHHHLPTLAAISVLAFISADLAPGPLWPAWREAAQEALGAGVGLLLLAWSRRSGARRTGGVRHGGRWSAVDGRRRRLAGVRAHHGPWLAGARLRLTSAGC